MYQQEHDGFSRDAAKLGKRHDGFLKGFESIKLLLERHFSPQNDGISCIDPGKIHRILNDNSGQWVIWKIEVAVKGLRPNQWPRVWFSHHGDKITFLAIASHTDNYSDKEITDKAIARWKEIS